MRTTWKPSSNKTKLTFLLSLFLSFNCLTGSSFGGFLKDLSKNKQDKTKMLLAHITTFTHTHANGEEHLERLTPEEIRIRDEKAATVKRIAEENLKNAMKGFIPEQQKEFLQIVLTNAEKYKNAKTDLKKSFQRKKRNEVFKKFFSNGLGFENWVGEIKKIDTNNSGDARILINFGGENLKNIYGGVNLNNYNNPIKLSNKLFDRVVDLESGDRVVVSGKFEHHDGSLTTGWYLNSYNPTEKGAMLSAVALVPREDD